MRPKLRKTRPSGRNVPARGVREGVTAVVPLVDGDRWPASARRRPDNAAEALWLPCAVAHGGIWFLLVGPGPVLACGGRLAVGDDRPALRNPERLRLHRAPPLANAVTISLRHIFLK